MPGQSPPPDHLPPPAPLPPAFFAADAASVARALLGKVLVHRGVAGLIVETEAYDETDPASHCYRGRTPRNSVMFGPGGRAYVYRSYGIHWCLNVCVGPAGYGAAVLLRALQPQLGLATMTERRGGVPLLRLARGPGCLAQALGITGAHNGADMCSPTLHLLPKPADFGDFTVTASPRIGITRAAQMPWRFYVTGNGYVSGRRGGTGRPPIPSPLA